MLKISNLFVKVEGKTILKDLNLEVRPGEIHSIMGPNGSGKSTLFKAISASSDCKIASGSILYRREPDMDYQDLLKLSAVERAKEGVFMAFQHPVEVPGVNNLNFLRASFNSICRHLGAEDMDEKSFLKFAVNKIKELGLSEKLIHRPLNEGLSGGEKKKNELLQMAVLSPALSLLDEIDSGLDIDSIKLAAEGIKKMRTKQNAIVLITHYHRLLKEIQPDYVHVLVNGAIKKTGGYSFGLELDKKGYDQWL